MTAVDYLTHLIGATVERYGDDDRGAAEYMIAHGVTVKVPEANPAGDVSSDPMGVFVPDMDAPAPTYQPGDVAIATVRGAEGVQVMRTIDDMYSWITPQRHVQGEHVHLDDQVTVTSRAVVVTEADRDELILLAGHPGLSDPLEVAHVIRQYFNARLGGAA